MSINGLQVIQILNKISEVMDENISYLSELDAAIGDGDLGLNMSNGFKAVKEKLSATDGNNIEDILKKTGITLADNVGGVLGPLYGTAFIKASVAANGKDSININDFLEMLETALSGIKIRGRAELGDKTLIDALEPALNSLRIAVNQGLNCEKCLYMLKEAAKKGAENTKTLVAKKGRASYLGEKCISHQDPGAVSIYLIFETIYNEIKLLK